jgi:hypothetical protein
MAGFGPSATFDGAAGMSAHGGETRHWVTKVATAALDPEAVIGQIEIPRAQRIPDQDSKGLPASTAGKVNLNTAPRGSFASAHSRPSWASMIDRQIDSPIPVPLDLVV